MVMTLSILLTASFHEIDHMTKGTEAQRQCGEVGVLCCFNNLYLISEERGITEEVRGFKMM